MIDRLFQICNNSNSFYNNIGSIKYNFIKNAGLPFLINKAIKKYLNYMFPSNQNQLKDTSDVHYFKLPYIGNLSHHIKNKLSKLCKVLLFLLSLSLIIGIFYFINHSLLLFHLITTHLVSHLSLSSIILH